MRCGRDVVVVLQIRGISGVSAEEGGESERPLNFGLIYPIGDANCLSVRRSGSESGPHGPFTVSKVRGPLSAGALEARYRVIFTCFGQLSIGWYSSVRRRTTLDSFPPRQANWYYKVFLRC
jgi:hypothetical protein